MAVSIVIPTYRRAEAPTNCLASIICSLMPEEIVIVGRGGDVETECWIELLTGL